MVNTLMILQAVVSILLIMIVLLQFGKGAEAGLFTGGGNDSVLSGPQKGNVLVKVTVVLSLVFFGNSIFLAKIQSEKTGSSILDDEAPVSRPLNNDAQRALEEKSKNPSTQKTDQGSKAQESAPQNP